MRTIKQTYHESWYRIAGIRPVLRPNVQVVRQYTRGKLWYVLRDNASNATIRIRNEAYAFVAMLDGFRTVNDVWEKTSVNNGDQSLTQGEVIQLLGQLYTSNLLRCEMPADSELLFQRSSRKKTQKLKSVFSNFLFIRIPIIDPDSLFAVLTKFFGWLFSRVGMILWSLILSYSGKSILEHSDALKSEFNTLLDPSNLVYLYISFVFIKFIHECGHGVACKQLGRAEMAHEVRTLGVMFLIFMPMPYVDVSSCWMFRSKWKRIVVSLGGMYAELIIAALAGIVWVQTGSGTLLHSLAYNMMVMASVGTILFNANPLMRFDGYYALIDWLEIPNLYTSSSRYLTFLFKRIIWGMRSVVSPASSLQEALLYFIYGILSFSWKIWISVSIILFIFDKFFFLGAFIAVLSFFIWVVKPLMHFLNYILCSHELSLNRFRAIFTSFFLFLSTLILICFYSFGDYCRVEGTVQPILNDVIYSKADGYLEYCIESMNVLREPETIIARIHNPFIESEIQTNKEEVNALEVQIRLAIQEQRLVDIRLLEARKQAFLRRLEKAEKEQAALHVKTNLQGVWESENLNDYLGTWVNRGQVLGRIVGPETIRLRVVVDQDEASRLFENPDFTISYRIAGRPDIGGSPMPCVIERIIPIGSNWLPNPALGFVGGGHQAVDHQADNGQKSLSNVFEVWLIPEQPPAQVLLAGQRVIVRFAFPEQPLATQWLRKIRQLFAKRYIQG